MHVKTAPLSPEQQRENFIRTVNGWAIPTLRAQYISLADAHVQQAAESEQRRRLLLESMTLFVWVEPQTVARVIDRLQELGDGYQPGPDELAACLGLLLKAQDEWAERQPKQPDPNPADVPGSGKNPVTTGLDSDGADASALEYAAPANSAWEGEVCMRCGQGYSDVWHAPDEDWLSVVGRAGGMLCTTCYARAAKEKGISPVCLCRGTGISYDQPCLYCAGDGKLPGPTYVHSAEGEDDGS